MQTNQSQGQEEEDDDLIFSDFGFSKADL